jgi:hypothetical protein
MGGLIAEDCPRFEARRKRGQTIYPSPGVRIKGNGFAPISTRTNVSFGMTINCWASAFYFLVLTLKSARPVAVKQAASHSETSVCKNKNTNAAATSSTIPAKRRLRFTLKPSLLKVQRL